MNNSLQDAHELQLILMQACGMARDGTYIIEESDGPIDNSPEDIIKIYKNAINQVFDNSNLHSLVHCDAIPIIYIDIYKKIYKNNKTYNNKVTKKQYHRRVLNK